jgi:hypothetical protein
MTKEKWLKAGGHFPGMFNQDRLVFVVLASNLSSIRFYAIRFQLG